MGAFHPTAVGEKLMPVLTGVQNAFREIARRDEMAVIEAYQARLSDRGMLESKYADLAAAESHFEGLALELRRPDGSLVRTNWIGIQDTHETRAFAEEQRARRVVDDEDDGPYDPELEASVMHDLELIEEWFGERDDEPDEPDDGDAWEADEERGEFERYQILLELGERL